MQQYIKQISVDVMDEAEKTFRVPSSSGSIIYVHLNHQSKTTLKAWNLQPVCLSTLPKSFLFPPRSITCNCFIVSAYNDVNVQVWAESCNLIWGDRLSSRCPSKGFTARPPRRRCSAHLLRFKVIGGKAWFPWVLLPYDAGQISPVLTFESSKNSLSDVLSAWNLKDFPAVILKFPIWYVSTAATKFCTQKLSQVKLTHICWNAFYNNKAFMNVCAFLTIS